MARLSWGGTGLKDFELGVDRGVLFVMSNSTYGAGVAWNGLVGVTEQPAGAEPTKVYADNGVYGVLMSPETLGLTIEHISAPPEFYACDGVLCDASTNYVQISGQPRAKFAFAYRTRVGDETSAEKGYKLHIIYGCQSGVAEKGYKTIGDSPEVITFSRTISTLPVTMADDKVTAEIVLDSRTVSVAGLAAVEDALYGTSGVPSHLPTPDEVMAMCEPIIATITPANPSSKAKNSNTTFTCNVPCEWSTNSVTAGTGVIQNSPVAGSLHIASDEALATVIVTATPVDTTITPVTVNVPVTQ